jgi:hypothetical protein
MSAPYEVWVKDGRWHTGESKAVPRTRYLRADLTCGECDYFHHTVADGYRCDWKWQSAGSAIPACMAFVPKEAK